MLTTLLESHVHPSLPDTVAAPSDAPPDQGNVKAVSFLLSSSLPPESPLSQLNGKPAGKRQSEKCHLHVYSLKGRVEPRAATVGRGGDRVPSDTTVSLVLWGSTWLTMYLSNHKVVVFETSQGLSCSNFSFKNSVDSSVRVY